MSDKEIQARAVKIAKKLQCSHEEAIQVVLDDLEVDKMTMKQLNAELTPEQKAAMKQAKKTGSRKPTVYKFDKSKRERKKNTTKATIISELAQFLKEKSENSIENLQILNEERQISFKIGDNDYELTLIQKRKTKKGD